MSDLSSSDWPHWNALTSTFRESYSLTNESVYDAAGDIWESALKFALSRNLDESEAREALLRAVASVSAQDTNAIEALHSYLFRAYANLINRLLTQQRHYASLESINQELSSDPDAAEVIEHDILLTEIVARMEEEMRKIYEGLILGYSFEELATKLGKPANSLRSKFSKGVKRIAREIRGSE